MLTQEALGKHTENVQSSVHQLAVAGSSRSTNVDRGPATSQSIKNFTKYAAYIKNRHIQYEYSSLSLLSPGENVKNIWMYTLQLGQGRRTRTDLPEWPKGALALSTKIILKQVVHFIT